MSKDIVMIISSKSNTHVAYLDNFLSKSPVINELFPGLHYKIKPIDMGYEITISGNCKFSDHVILDTIISYVREFAVAI
jgi:hypothetical protein